MLHRFSLGQSVTYTASPFEASGSSGRYTIIQLLPAEFGEYSYAIQREKTGELRRAHETQLRPLPLPAASPKSPARRPRRRPLAHLAAGAA